MNVVDACVSSGAQTATALIYTGACRFYGIVVTATGDWNLFVYDNTAGSGTRASRLIGDVSVQGHTVSHMLEMPVAMQNGIYVVLMGTATYTVYYA